MCANAQVRAMMRAEPFRPFLVRLADGRSFAVRHPENVSWRPDGREMVVHDEEGMHLLEQLLVIELVALPTKPMRRRK